MRILNAYREFDFIWSSPPCPSHSDIRRCGVHSGKYEAIYPDMGLYQEIILLKHFAPKETKWVIENVRPYYEPLIKPTKILQRHYFWTNLEIKDFIDNEEKPIISGNGGLKSYDTIYGFNLEKYKVKYNGGKRKCLRNLVNPKLALHILNSLDK